MVKKLLNWFESNRYNEIRNSIVISEQMINSKESKKEMMDSDEKNRNIFQEKENKKYKFQ